MKRAVFLSLLIILCLVAACGCAGGSVERGALLLETDHAAASNGGGRAEESRSMRTEVGEAMIGEKRAREIALKHAGVEEAAATRMKVETDREKGRQIYEVEFTAGAKKYEYEIDAHTGEVISFEQKAVQKAVQKAAVKGGADTKKSAGGGAAVEKGTAGQGSALIGKDAALKVALKHAGVSDSKVLWQEVELDYEKGRQIYEVEFSAGEKKYEYDIDACTGKVISHEYKVKQATPTEKVERLIGEKAAWEIALKHAGVAASQAMRLEIELDYEKGRRIYELEFYAGEKEYEYEIDAGTGAILSCGVESRKAPR